MAENTYISELSKGSSHLIVQFSKLNSSGLRVVELICRSWTRKKRNSQWACKFPPKKDYMNLHKWLSKEIFPMRHWKEYGIFILKEANSVDQGLRRLDRALKSHVIETSTFDQSCVTSEEENSYTGDTSDSDCNETAISILESAKNVTAYKDKGIKDSNDSVNVNLIDREPSLASSKESGSAATGDESPKSTKKKLKKRKPQRISKISETSEDSINSNTKPSTINEEKDREQLVDSRNKQYFDHERKSLMSKFKRVLQVEVNGNDNSKTPELEASVSQKTTDSIVQRKKNLSSKSKSPYDINLDHLITSDGKLNENMTLLEFYVLINERTMKGLETLERRILYNLNRKLNIISDAVNVNQAASTIDALLQSPILRNLPKGNLDDFKEFDANIKNDAELQVIEYMVLLATGTKNVRNAINVVLPMFLTKNVQLQYSGVGKVTKGIRKENFSKTNIYKCLESVIIQNFQNSASKKDILSCTSRWLSDSVDREGGKQQRHSKNQNGILDEQA